MDKVQLRKQVAFIGNVATEQGLCVDPHKVRAESEMLPIKMLQPYSAYWVSLNTSVILAQPLRYHKTIERMYPE